MRLVGVDPGFAYMDEAVPPPDSLEEMMAKIGRKV